MCIRDRDEVDEDGNLTGERIQKYSNTVRVLARVSPNSGNAEDSPFGKDIVYDKTISNRNDFPSSDLEEGIFTFMCSLKISIW